MGEKASENELMEKQIEILPRLGIVRVLTAARRQEPRPGANLRTQRLSDARAYSLTRISKGASVGKDSGGNEV